MLNSTYSMYQVFAPMIQGQMAGQGLEVELPTLPTQASIMPHIRPHVSTLRKMPDGLKFEGRYTMPVAVGADPTTIGVGVALLLPAVQAAREAARRNQSMNNMKQIMLAFHNHHDVYKKFPAAAITDKEEKPLLSWRVKILPFIDEGELYKEFHLDEPWDSEHNKTLIPRMPVAYLNPSRANNGDGTTTYLLPTGKSSLFKDPVKAVNLREIVDGTSRTIAVVEADEDRAVPWTRPDDLKLDADKPLKDLGNLRPGGFLAAFADGSVRFISSDIDKTVLQALFTRDGREVVEVP